MEGIQRKIGSKEDIPTVDIWRYPRLIGEFINWSNNRPDIAFPVSILSQFMNWLTNQMKNI